MISRRSFLAAIMGAFAAPVVALDCGIWKTGRIEELPPESSPWVFGDWTRYVSRHYTVWDSVVVRPGEVLNERLLPPPVPEDFWITSIATHFNIEAPVRSVAHVARAVNFTLRNGESDILRAPLFVLPVDACMRLVEPYVAQKGDDLGIYLDSNGAAVSSADRVTVSIILQGIVRWKAGA